MGNLAFSVAAIMVAGFNVALADEFDCQITKVDGDKITIVKNLKKKKQEQVVLTVAKDPIVEKGGRGVLKKVYAIDGGLKNEMFSGERTGRPHSYQ